MAHLYERRKFPYPGDEEAIEEFIKSGGALGTTIGPKGFADANMDSENMQKQLQSKKFEQEAQKLWLRMRNEVVQELQEKGFDIEWGCLNRLPSKLENYNLGIKEFVAIFLTVWNILRAARLYCK